MLGGPDQSPQPVPPPVRRSRSDPTSHASYGRRCPCPARSRSLATSRPPAIVLQESRPDLAADRRRATNLIGCPHPELQDQMELRGLKEPSVAVARRAGRQEVRRGIVAAACVRHHVVRVPGSVKRAAAHVASPVRLSGDLRTHRSGRRSSPCSPLRLQGIATRLQVREMPNELLECDHGSFLTILRASLGTTSTISGARVTVERRGRDRGG